MQNRRDYSQWLHVVSSASSCLEVQHSHLKQMVNAFYVETQTHQKVLEINTSLWRLKASRGVGFAQKCEGEATSGKVSSERSEMSLVLCPDHMCGVFFSFFFFFYRACVARKTATEAAPLAPRGSGPCTGAQRSFISVTVCKQQLFPEAFHCYFWPFSLTSLKHSKQINKIKLDPSEAAQTQQSFSRGLDAAPSLASCGSRCWSCDHNIWGRIPAEQRRRRC